MEFSNVKKLQFRYPS